MANKKVLGEIFDVLGGEIPSGKRYENEASESGASAGEEQDKDLNRDGSVDVRIPEGYGFVVARISKHSLELFRDIQHDKKKFNSMLNLLDPLERRAIQQYFSNLKDEALRRKAKARENHEVDGEKPSAHTDANVERVEGEGAAFEGQKPKEPNGFDRLVTELRNLGKFQLPKSDLAMSLNDLNLLIASCETELRYAVIYSTGSLVVTDQKVEIPDFEENGANNSHNLTDWHSSKGSVPEASRGNTSSPRSQSSENSYLNGFRPTSMPRIDWAAVEGFDPKKWEENLSVLGHSLRGDYKRREYFSLSKKITKELVKDPHNLEAHFFRVLILIARNQNDGMAESLTVLFNSKSETRDSMLATILNTANQLGRREIVDPGFSGSQGNSGEKAS